MKNIKLENIPDDFYRQITEIAAQENRSINQQILVFVEKAIRLHNRPQPDLIEKIDFRREKMAERVGIMPDSTVLLREDRER